MQERVEVVAAVVAPYALGLGVGVALGAAAAAAAVQLLLRRGGR